MHRAILFVSLSLAATVAPASTILGNPAPSIILIDDATVFVDDVIAIDCATSTQTTIVVDETLEELESTQVSLTADEDYCGLEIVLRWAPADPLVTVPVDGFDVFSTSNASPAVEIELDAGLETATLVP